MPGLPGWKPQKEEKGSVLVVVKEDMQKKLFNDPSGVAEKIPE